MRDQEPWWICGAVVSDMLEILGMIAGAAKISVEKRDMNDADMLFLHEQLFYDALRAGINQDAGKRLRKATGSK